MNFITELFAYEGLSNRALRLSLSDNWGTDSEVYNLEYYRTEGRWDIAFDPEYPFIYLIDSVSRLSVMKLQREDDSFALDNIKDGLFLSSIFKTIYEPHTFILTDIFIERSFLFIVGDTKVYLGQDSEYLYIVFDSSYLCDKR